MTAPAGGAGSPREVDPDRQVDPAREVAPDREVDPGRQVTVREAVVAATAVLAEAGVPSPRVDAHALAAHALGVPDLVLAFAHPAGEAFLARYAGLVERRRRREPLQHVLGWMAFRRLRLPAGPGTFVVRPETEVVAGVAIEEAAAVVAQGREPVVADLCTGSGAIALAVATEVPGARVHAVELSPVAVEAARHAAAGLARLLAHPVDIREGDVRTCLPDLDGQVDVVVANPPYVPADAVPVDPEVRDHDPDLALYGGGADGLDVPRAVVATAARLLRPGGLLVMEHADVQGRAARDLVRRTGVFGEPVTRPDLTGRDRMVVARRR